MQTVTAVARELGLRMSFKHIRRFMDTSAAPSLGEPVIWLKSVREFRAFVPGGAQDRFYLLPNGGMTECRVYSGSGGPFGFAVARCSLEQCYHAEAGRLVACVKALRHIAIRHSVTSIVNALTQDAEALFLKERQMPENQRSEGDRLVTKFFDDLVREGFISPSDRFRSSHDWRTRYAAEQSNLRVDADRAPVH